MSSTREHLLGYLLGALEPAEMAAVERDLEHNPRLRKDLSAIEAAMTPLGFPERDDDASFDSPPRNLTVRTCEFVDDARRDVVSKPSPVVAMSPERGSGSTRRFRWADAIVTGSVLAAALALLFPAILSSRQSAQIVACQNNLRQLGISLANYAGQSSDGRIPAIPLSGPRSTAGIYSALLKDRQLLEDSKYLVCASSDLAEHADTFRVPSLSEIDRTTGEAQVQVHRTLGGSYGYNMGYVENGVHCAPKYEGRSHYALMSDAPSTFWPERKTRNHGGCGQNILYEDNRVKWVVDVARDLSEDPYLNRNGIVAAGLDRADVVMGESLAKPFSPFYQPLK